jgi:hypothetical protein
MRRSIMNRKNAGQRMQNLLRICVALAPVMTLLDHLPATETDWTGGDGNWSASGNWSNGVPGSGYDAGPNYPAMDTLDRTITYDYTGSVTLNSFALGAPTFLGGTPTTTLSMSAHNLTSTVEYIGGAPAYFRRGVVNQSGGVNTVGSGNLYLGYHAADAYAAGTPADEGTYNLSGSATLTSNSGFEYVGYSGIGTINQLAGANSSVDLFLGYNAGSSGTYNLNSGSLTQTFYESVGYNGTGVFTQTGGSHTVTNGYIDIASGANSTGSYLLSGGSLTTASGMVVGDYGNGSMTQSGGTFTASNVVGVGSGANSTGVYTLNSGALSAAGETIGLGQQSNGIFEQTGGTNTITSGSTLLIGSLSNSTGAYYLDGGTLTSNGYEIVGDHGTATFNQTAGINKVTNNNDYFSVGNNTNSVGVYNLSGTGSLSVTANEYIGVVGNGTFNQYGGTNTINSANHLIIGDLSGGVGVYNLYAGSASVTGSVYVGGSNVGAGGTGTLAVAGGTLTVSGTLVAYNTAGSAINLSGGQINAAALNFNGTPSLFLAGWTGGTLNLTSNVTWDSNAMATTTGGTFGAALTLGANQNLMISGNETLGGVGPFTLELGAGSSHYVTGTLALSPTGIITQDDGSSLYAATFTQAGGVVNGTLQNQGTFNYQSGAFNGRLLNQGTVTFTASFTAGNGVENDATLTLAAGQTLIANGSGLDNIGSLILNGGVVSGNALAINEVGGTIQGHGAINPAVSNFGTVTVSGVLAFNGGATNYGLIQGSGTVSGGISNDVAGSVSVAAGNSLAVTTAWTNAGLMALLGSTARISGGGITNTGMIQGLGLVSSAIDNSGVVEALSGTLSLGGSVQNEVDGLFTAGSGSKLLVTAGLAANAGVINLTGGTFDNNSHPLSNTGQISGWGIFRTGGAGLDNFGSITFSGGLTTINGNVTNEDGQTITVAQNPAIFTGLVINGSAPGSSATFTTTNATATFAGGFTNNGGSNFIALGNGLIQVNAAPTLRAASSLSIQDTSTLKFKVVSGSATVGAGVTATVANGATLELAGSVPALSAGSNRVNIVNNSSAAAGVLISGTHQVVGGIDGTGHTQVNDGSDLTADHIIQSSLVLGSGSMFTLAPSDADGNPMASGFVLAGSVAPASSYLAPSDSLLSDGSTTGSSPSISLGGASGPNGSAVPEPSTMLLVLLGGLAAMPRARRIPARPQTTRTTRSL